MSDNLILLLRSLAFNVAFFGWTILCAFLLLPLFLCPHAHAVKGGKLWIRGIFWICRYVLGLHVRVVGYENLPKGPVILAAKHQSAWETFVFHYLFSDPAIALKQELLWIPFFGWYLKKTGMIPLSRSKGKGVQDLKNLLGRARDAAEKGRQIVIFPEGTRSKPGHKGTYQSGVASLYSHLKLPIIPVAHNAGLYWPRRGFIKYPGTVTIEFLAPIHPGLSRQDFMCRLEDVIEIRTNELVAHSPTESIEVLTGILIEKSFARKEN